MAFSFRASKSFGPLRINFSKSGIGGSIGMNGLRLGVNSKGKGYTSVSIPGSGIYGRQTFGQSSSRSNTSRQISKGENLNTLGFIYDFEAYLKLEQDSLGCTMIIVWVFIILAAAMVSPILGIIVGADLI